MQPFSTKPGPPFQQNDVYKIILSASNQNHTSSIEKHNYHSAAFKFPGSSICPAG